MTWGCSDCGEENSDESVWYPECGQERLCDFDGEPVEEALRTVVDRK